MKMIATPRFRQTGNVHTLFDGELKPTQVSCTSDGELIIRTYLQAPNSTSQYRLRVSLTEREALLLADRATFWPAFPG